MNKSDINDQKRSPGFFSGIIGVTPSDAALGDANPSDATDYGSFQTVTNRDSIAAEC